MRAIVVVIAALCVGACAIETQDDPILAAARAVGLRKPSCLGDAPNAFQGSGQGNCGSAARRPPSALHNAIAARTRTNGQQVAINVFKRMPLSGDSNNIDVAPEAVPSLNIEASCQDAATAAFDRNVSRCLSDERRARDELASKWREYPPSYRSQCAGYSSRSGGGTYTDLLTCLEMDLHARELSDRGRRKAQAAN
jgi:hypothetical protein